MARKPTGILDQQQPATRDAIFAHCEGCTLDAGVNWLQSEWGIELEKSALAAWLNKERTDRKFTARLVQIDEARERTGKLANGLATALSLTETNAALFAQALLDAQLANNPDAVAIATEGLATLLKPLLKSKADEDKREALALDRKKYEDAKQTKIQAGLAALREQVKGNKAAETAVDNLEAAIAA